MGRERVVNEGHVQFEWDMHKAIANMLNKNQPMNNLPTEDDDIPSEIDFSKGVRGLHHIPSDAIVLLPASIEQDVWEYFSKKAEKKGVDLSELLTEVLKRDIEINEALN